MPMDLITRIFHSVIFSHSFLFFVVLILAIWIGKFINDLIARYKINEELVVKNNPAVGTALAGYYLGLAIAVAGVMLMTSISMGKQNYNFWKDGLLITAIYSIIAIIFMNIATFVINKLILYKFDDKKELVEDQNVGTGAVMAGSYIATGLIISSSVSGEISGRWWDALLPAVVFFVLGQIVLVLAGLWYQAMARYDVHKAIGDDNNAAAGISFGGFMFTIGYIVNAAISGESQYSWFDDIVLFALYVVMALILLTIGYWVTDWVFLPKAKMSDEVGKQANIGAAAISVAINVGIAILIVHVL